MMREHISRAFEKWKSISIFHLSKLLPDQSKKYALLKTFFLCLIALYYQGLTL